MAPWPEKGNEPKAPDKFSQIGENLQSDISKVNLVLPANLDVNVIQPRSDGKQNEEKNSDVSNLDDGQLKALLDEAITYKCPKDREGKSNLFRELLQEVEADESKDEDTHHGNMIRSSDIGGCRYFTGSRRKNRRDGGISEHQSKGGSLQNLVQALSSEFDGAASLGYFTSGHVGASSRRRTKKNSCSRDGVSVSARQREGGSLPSNVNVGGVQGGGIFTLSGFELTPKSTVHSDESRNFFSKTAVSVKRKDKTNYCSSHVPNEELVPPVDTNIASLGGDVPCHSVPKHDFMVIELGDFNISGDRNRTVQDLSCESRNVDEIGRVDELQVNIEKKLSGDIMDDKVCCVNRNLGEESVTETRKMQSSDGRTKVNYTTLATLEVGNSRLQDCNGDVDSSVRFPFPQQMHNTQPERRETASEIAVCHLTTAAAWDGNRGYTDNSDSYATTSDRVPALHVGMPGDRDDRVQCGVEQNPLQLTASFSSVKCIAGSSSTSSSAFLATPSTSTGVRDADQSIKGTGAELYRKVPTGETTKTSMIHPNVYPTHHLSVLSIPPNHTWITSLGPSGEGRLTFHGTKEGDTKCKSLDENGNALSQAYRLEGIGSNERKSKQRRAKIFNDRNVIMSQNIEGHRGDKDIESLIKFIESDTESKGRHKHASHHNGTLTLNSKQHRISAKKDDIGSIKSKRDSVHDDERGCKTRIQGAKNISKDKCSEKNKLKKSSSLEEISKSKIEDLMSFTRADTDVATLQENMNTFKHTHLVSDFVAINKKCDSSRELCIGDNPVLFTPASANVDDCTSFITAFSEGKKWQSEVKNKSDSRTSCTDENVATNVQVEEMEFHVVTKKQRRKKRCSSTGGKSGISLFDMSKHNGTSYVAHVPKDFLSHQSQKGNGFSPHEHVVNHSGEPVVLYQYRHHRPCSPEHHRRKSTSSMPPSEKSDSSDLDSVHSLPVSSTTPKLDLDKTSTSSGSTPQASYADIARMAATSIVPITGNCSSFNSSKLSSMTSSKIASFASSISVSSSTMPSSSQLVSAGSKISIGTPPVSGSKVFVVGNVYNPVSFSEEVLECNFSSEVDKSGIQQQDNCQKKETVANIAVNYKQIPNHCVEHLGKSGSSDPSQGNVLNDYYPSLEESLFVDKCDRKSGKICNPSFPARSLVSNLNVPISSLVKKYVDIVCTDQSSVVNVHAVNLENTLSTNVMSGEVGSMKNMATETCDLKDSGKNLSRQLSLKLSIQESVLKLNSSVSDQVTSTEDCNFKAANFSQSVKLRNKSKEFPKLKSSRINSYSSQRPPVILMNESRREEIVCDSDLTFGFEVNEQLLLSNEDDELCEKSAVPVNEKPCSREKSAAVEKLPRNTFSIEKFLARFQKPHAHVTDDKIINFVGYAWNDIMKEVNSANSKVQYYNGQ